MTNFHVQIDAAGCALLTLDVPGRSTNTLTAPAIEELGRLIEECVRDGAVRGVVLTSGKANDFCAGADTGELEDEIALCQAAKTPQERQAAGERLWRIGRLFRRIETCGKPVAAAINGAALGGGLELALACHYRIAADRPDIKLGFPEVTLGLIPGAGATQRLPRLIGIKKALPLLLEGRPITSAQAVQLGIVHGLAAPDQLVAEAKRWLAEQGDAVAPWDRQGFVLPGGGPYSPSCTFAFASSIAATRARTFGHYPAEENVLKAVYEGSLVSIEAGLRIEERYSLRTVCSPQAKAMTRSMFTSMRHVSKGSARPAEQPAREIRKIAVLGAGLMGSGIAHVQAMAGIETVLIDVDQPTAERGKAYSLKLLNEAVTRGRMTAAEAERIASLIRPTADFAEIAGADLIIEAVFEERSVKADVIARAMRFAGPETIFGSNTSSLPIDSLADASPRPEAFVGIHFFSPVERMQLVEIIKGRRTGPAAVAAAMDYTMRIRKVPIVVNDSRAFYTSRVFGTYLAEGFTMLSEGIAPSIIENVGRMTGMPRGPLELADDVGLDVLYRADKQAAADLGAGYRPRPEERITASLVERGRIGRKARKGFYDYPDGPGPKTLWTGLRDIAAPIIRETDAQLVAHLQDRLLFRQAIEAVRCVQEGVITDPRQADVGAILGWGFPRWTGGPLSFIDGMGIGTFVQRAERLAERCGDRFTPSDLLRTMLAEGKQFYD